MDDNGYLRRANEALVMAEKATDQQIRRAFLEIALEWQRLAKHVMRMQERQSAARALSAQKADHRSRPH